MFAINVITIFCVYFIVHSESAFCCAKYKYVTDTRGVNIKKCVLSVLCPRDQRNVENDQDIDFEDENYVEIHQNYLKELEEYASEHQINNKRFQNYIKYYENFIKDLQDYKTGSKTSEKHIRIVNKFKHINDEYENYIQEFLAQYENQEVPEDPINETSNENNDSDDENGLELYQKRLKKFKQYANAYQITDKRFQHFVKNYENFVKEYTSIVNKHQQLRDEHKNYIEEFLNQYENEEDPEDPINETNDENNDSDDENYVKTHQNDLKKYKQYASKYQITDKRFHNFVENYENFVKEYTSIVNKYQQLDDEYENYIKNFLDQYKNKEIPENRTNEKKNQNNDISDENYVKLHQFFLQRLKQYAKQSRTTDKQFQDFVNTYENFVKDMLNYVTGSKSADEYTNIMKKFDQIEKVYKKYIKELGNYNAFNQDNINVRRKRSVESEEYLNNNNINPEVTEFEKCYWKYKKFGAKVCYQAKLQLYSPELKQVFPFLDEKKSDKIDEKYEMMNAVQNTLDEVGRGMEDENYEDNNINVLLTSNRKITGQKKNRPDSMLTAAPNCFEGSGSLAHNHLCREEFFDY